MCIKKSQTIGTKAVNNLKKKIKEWLLLLDIMNRFYFKLFRSRIFLSLKYAVVPHKFRSPFRLFPLNLDYVAGHRGRGIVVYIHHRGLDWLRRRLSSGRSLRSAPLPPCSSPRVRPVLRLSPKNTHIIRSSFDSEVSKLQRFSVGMTDRVKTSCACNFAGNFGKFSWQHGGMGGKIVHYSC